MAEFRNLLNTSALRVDRRKVTQGKEKEGTEEADSALKQQIKGSQEFEIIELSAIEKNNYFKSLNV